MKRIYELAATVAVLSLLGACATPEYSMTPVASGNTSVTYDQGTAVVASDGRIAAVKVTPMGITGGGFLKVAVAVINHGTSAANLGIENVTIADDSGNALHVYTTRELTKIAQQRAVRAELAIAVLGGLAAAANSEASYSTSYGNVGGTSFTVRTYDPVAADIANERTSEETGAALHSIDRQLNGIIASVHDSALQTTTVNPAMGYGGLVWAAPPKGLSEAKGPITITVTVTFADEPHEFKFQLAKQ